MSSVTPLGERTLEGDIEAFSADLARYLDGKMTPAMFKAKRVPMGVYEQRQSGMFMQRVRAPGGRITASQAALLAEVAAEYSAEDLHLTTRQDMQLHGLAIENLGVIMNRLAVGGLSSRGGGGNTVRNITACTYASICPAEKFDVAPYVDAVTNYMVSIEGSYNLPRKYKIAFSGCAADCTAGKVNDLGFIAAVKDGQPGFRVVSGGGMGSGPRIGSVIEEWVPASECLAVAEAMRRVFDAHGDRKNRQKARLRFVFERLGREKVIEEYLEHKKSVLAEGLIVSVDDVAIGEGSGEVRPQLEQRDGAWIVCEAVDGLVSVRLFFESGLLPAEHLKGLAEAADRFSGTQRLRLTVDQGLLIESVKISEVGEVAEAVKALSASYLERGWKTSVVACAGAATCRLGLCLSRGLVKGCEEYFEKSGISPDGLEEELVRINGCPNACGKHPIGGIGLSGAAKRHDGQLYPAYSVSVGGIGGADPKFGEPVGSVPAKAVPELLAELISAYRAKAENGQTFSDYVKGFGTGGFSAIVEKHSVIPQDAIARDFNKDWGSDEQFSLAGRGAGECGAGVFEVVSEDIALAEARLKDAGSGGGEALGEALLATARSLLIIRGVDESEPDAVFRQFESNYIDSGLVSEDFRGLIVKGRSYCSGSSEALDGASEKVGALLARVRALYDSLDSSLKFNIGGEEAPVEQGGGSGSGEHELDLKGVSCPINFVKAKLKLETIPVGDVLAVTLDDGAPVQNVPASFKQEGQEIVSMDDIGSGHWIVKVKRVK